MGNYPIEDEDLTILNSTWVGAANWNFGAGWVLNPPFGVGWNFGGGVGDLSQAPFGTVIGNDYTFRFNMANAVFANAPAGGIRVDISGAKSQIFSANGFHETELIAINDTQLLKFELVNVVGGDSCDLLSCGIIINGNYVSQILKIAGPLPEATEYRTGVITTNYALQASYNGRTNCLISFNR